MRRMGLSSTKTGSIVHTRKKEEKAGDPEIKMFLDQILIQCAAAGFGEVQLVGAPAAVVERAKVMIEMKRMHAPLAFPSDARKARADYRRKPPQRIKPDDEPLSGPRVLVVNRN